MSTVLSHVTMSLDGFVADPDDRPCELFDWYDGGDVAVPSANENVTFSVDEASAEVLRGWTSDIGALVAGRRLFDLTDGWDDRHPVGAPVVVVTHRPPDDAGRWPRTTFVDGVEAAIARAREIAGGERVVVASADVVRQALDLGLVDEVHVSLVPVLFGEGVSYFGPLAGGHVLLDDPDVTVGRRAVHLRYRVRR